MPGRGPTIQPWFRLDRELYLEVERVAHERKESWSQVAREALENQVNLHDLGALNDSGLLTEDMIEVAEGEVPGSEDGEEEESEQEDEEPEEAEAEGEDDD